MSPLAMVCCPGLLVLPPDASHWDLGRVRGARSMVLTPATRTVYPWHGMGRCGYAINTGTV